MAQTGNRPIHLILRLLFSLHKDLTSKIIASPQREGEQELDWLPSPGGRGAGGKGTLTTSPTLLGQPQPPMSPSQQSSPGCVFKDIHK